jgi:hypothetical protein
MKFAFEQKVRVKSGFFQGQTGRVRSTVSFLWLPFTPRQYLVTFDKCDRSEWILERHLINYESN